MLVLSSFLHVPVVSALVPEPCRRRQAAARREPRSRASGPCRRAPPLRPALLNLPSPAALSTPRRSAAAAAQFAAGPPLAVVPPLQTTPSPQTTTHRCARAPSTFSPTSPSPPEPNLAGNGAVRPSSVLQVRQGPLVRRNKLPGA